jgi:hypothetical protein
MQNLQAVAQRRGNWVRESEHIVVRLVSLAFSVASAYQIRWFFEPLDSGDPIHYVLWWLVSVGFGLLGFYLSRGIAHRLMQKESILAYAPIFVLMEFFEILCNYAKAVTAVSTGSVPWVLHAPLGQQGLMAVLTYVGWSILPLVSPLMGVADMDVTRQRNGELAAGRQAGAAGQSRTWQGQPQPRQAVGPVSGQSQAQVVNGRGPLPRPGQPQPQVQMVGANGANPPQGISPKA